MPIVKAGTTIKKLIKKATTCQKGIYKGVTVFEAKEVWFPSEEVKKSANWSGAYFSASDTRVGMRYSDSAGSSLRSNINTIPIDFTNWNTLHITTIYVPYTAGDGRGSKTWCAIKNANNIDVLAVGATLTGETNTLDISKMSGKHFVHFNASHGQQIYITSLYMD